MAGASQTPPPAAMQQAAAPLQLLLDTLRDRSFCMLDPEGRVLSWNAGARLLTGHEAAEMLGQGFQRLFLPEDARRGEPEALLARALANGRLQVEGWRRHRDGSARPVSIALQALHDAQGRHQGFAETCRALGEAGEPLAEPGDDRFRLAMQHAAIGMVLVGLDGRFLRVNRAVCALLGYEEAELRRMTFAEVSHPAELPQDMAQLQALLRGEGDSYRLEKRYLRKDGSAVWAELTVSLVRDRQGRPEYFISQIQDSSHRRAAEAALEEARERLQVTLHSIADGVITTDAEGLVTFLNPAAAEMTGWREAEAIGQPAAGVLGPLTGPGERPLPDPVRAVLAGDRVFRLGEVARLAERGGARVEIQLSAAAIQDRCGRRSGAVLVFQNIGLVLRMQRQLEFSAQHDALTSLPNRRRLEVLLEEALRQAQREGRCHTLCFLDLDRFKIVNDTAGHGAGDALLTLVAHHLREGLRKQDLLARLGGDEFAIILYDCSPAEAVPLLERAIEGIAALQLPWNGRSHQVTVSIGATAIDAALASADAAMKQADVACFAAKHGGRNRLSVYDGSANAASQAHREILMVAELRAALEEGRLQLQAQQIAALRGPQQPRYELLLRLRGAEGGLVSPAQFIAVAERYDLMGEIDRWVLREVLQRHAARLAAIPGLKLSVNVSANSLNDPRFLPFFLALLEGSALPPAALTLEITETAMVNNLAAASGIIDRIRAAGCRIALDDFGIGLSSFGYLRAFKVDCIKIEGSFVRNICNSAIDLAIVRSINRIAQEIEAETVAEFAEDAAILEKLREIGVDAAQGYAIAPPLDLEALLSGGAAPAAS